DYSSKNGTLSFGPGETVKTIAVTVNGSAIPQEIGRASCRESDAANAGVSKAKGKGTIHNQAAAPAISINDVVVNQPASGSTGAIFTVSLSGASGKTVSVDYATADGSALAPGDYSSKNGTLSFAPGETVKTIAVTVNGSAIPQ